MMDELFRLKESMTKVKECSNVVESFLDGSQKLIDSLITSSKVIADFSKCTRTNQQTLDRPSHVVDYSRLLGDKEKEVCSLHVDGFDSEQIWQGIEISNDPLLKALSSKINKLHKNGTSVSLLRNEDKPIHKDIQTSSTKKNQKQAKSKAKKESIGNSRLNFTSGSGYDDNGGVGGGDDDDDHDHDLDDMEQSENIFDEHEKVPSQKRAKKHTTQSVVDDGFFVLEDMNRFLDFEDKREMRKDDGIDHSSPEDIDYFGEDFESDDDSDDDELTKALESASKSIGRLRKRNSGKTDAKAMMYADFFDEPPLQAIRASKKSLKTKRKNENGYMDAGSEGTNDMVGIEEKVTNEAEDMMENDDDYKDGDSSDSSELASSNESEADLSEQSHLLENISTKLDEKSSVRSRFEKESIKMQEKIKEIEAENIAQKPWQLTGEATAAKRPKNSLLEENMYFDQTLVATPTVTEETTETLEQMITQRIKDQAWDDVVRKVKPIEKPFEYKRSLNTDQEKSKLSLAEIYEKEYIKQTEEVEEEQVNPDHEEIETMMKKLFAKLDALSNFQFTPKQPKPDLKVISNLPSVAMEESTPITVSNSSMLAPEEIYDKKRSDLKGENERTATDKKRERRKKKIRKRVIAKAKERKLKEKEMKNPGMVAKASQRAALQKLSKSKRVAIAGGEFGKSLKSSTAFFTHLQENVRKHVKKTRETTVKSKKDNVHKGEKYKL